MSVEIVRVPKGLAPPGGMYSHLSIARGSEIVTVAGQGGFEESGGYHGDGSVASQTRQTFENIVTALKALGLGPPDIFKTTTYLVGAENIDEFHEARASMFASMYPDEMYPPNTLVVVSRLAEERLLVEIEAFAVR